VAGNLDDDACVTISLIIAVDLVESRRGMRIDSLSGSRVDLAPAGNPVRGLRAARRSRTPRGVGPVRPVRLPDPARGTGAPGRTLSKSTCGAASTWAGPAVDRRSSCSIGRPVLEISSFR
jgi:hypothetical protein